MTNIVKPTSQFKNDLKRIGKNILVSAENCGNILYENK